MNKRIIVFTQTHNNENTIARCIDSVLKQNYPHIAAYYIADNNSTDGTRDIIDEYARLDNRIIPVYRNDNIYWQIYFCLPEILRKFNSSDYFIAIDSDDEYDITAFEKLVDFMDKNQLDIAASTSNFIDGETGVDLNKKPLENDLIISGSDFDIKFPEYFRFVMDYWGMLFPLSILKNIDFQSLDNTLMNSSPTFIFFETLRNADRIGVMSERLYKYYIYPQSWERTASKRVVTVKLYNYFKDFIIQKCGYISDANKAFIYGAYIKALRNRLKPIISSDAISPDDKLELLNMVFEDRMTNEMCEFVLLQLEGNKGET